MPAPGAAADDGEELLEEVHGERRVVALRARPVQARVVLGVHVRLRIAVLVILLSFLHLQIVLKPAMTSALM